MKTHYFSDPEASTYYCHTHTCLTIYTLNFQLSTFWDMFFGLQKLKAWTVLYTLISREATHFQDSRLLE